MTEEKPEKEATRKVVTELVLDGWGEADLEIEIEDDLDDKPCD